MANAQTATKPKQQFTPQQPPNQGALAVQEPRLPYVPAAQEKFGIDPDAWQALTDAIFPTAKTVAGIMLALSYCKWRKLDPFKRTVHIVPIYNAKLKREVETVWPGISELRTTAFRTKDYAGCDDCQFGPMQRQSFTDKVKKYRDQEEYYEAETVEVSFPEWAQMTVYRMVQGQRVAFVGPKVRWLHAYGKRGKTMLPNEMWARRSDEQIEKCAEAAALRRAFPEEMGGEMSAEEMSGQHVMDLGDGVTVETPNRPNRNDFNGKTDGAKDVAEDGSTEQKQAAEPEKEEPEGHDLIDETGVVTATIADDTAYTDAVIALFEKATELKHVQTIADNNLEALNALPKALGKKARVAFEAATARLKAAGAGKPAEEQKSEPDKAPAAEKRAGDGKLTLKNSNGKVVEKDLDELGFAVALDKLFKAAEIRIDLDALWHHNLEAIGTLPDHLQDPLVQALEQAKVALGQPK